MGYTVVDHIHEWLHESEVFWYDADPYRDNVDPWNPDEEEYDSEDGYSSPITPKQFLAADDAWGAPVEFDPDVVAEEIQRHYQYQKELKEEGSLRFTTAYYTVFRDGTWHFNDAQLYSILENDPYLDPWDWVDQKIILESKTFQKAKHELEEKLEGVAAVGESNYNCFEIRVQGSKEDFEKAFGKSNGWRAFKANIKYIGSVTAQGE